MMSETMIEEPSVTFALGAPPPPRLRRPRRRRSRARASRLASGGLRALAHALGWAGAVCLAWLLIAWLFGLGLVVLVTGSMAPGMPAGTAALVQRVPASAVAVGDVVTVPVPGAALPVTHRVVAVEPLAAELDADDAGVRELVLRGDANRSDDPLPYRVAEVQRVLIAAPGLGHLIVAGRHPLVLTAAAVLAGAAITWAFWPAKPVAASAPGRARASESSEVSP